MPIPKRDVISFLIRESLKDAPAKSQRELADLINSRIRRSGSGSVSPSRARSIAALSPGISVRILTRTGPAPSRCPACGHALRKAYIKNLRGRNLLYRLKCPRCTYTASDGRWVPRRYEFRLN
jgi:hypothetical protein